jgi:hypothetical protein
VSRSSSARKLAASALALTALAAAPAAAGTAGGPSVRASVVGKHRVLDRARTVRARATTVRIGGRRCAVGAGTPLAALLAVRRDVRIRDYASCGRRAADAGGLFVFQIGSERNRGTDGWVYTVDGRKGTTGAADPSGPFGTGRRLRAGDRVVWLWCTMTARGTCRKPPA